METQDIILEPKKIINSSLLNTHFNNVYTDISNLFDLNFELLGKVDLVNIGLKLIDISNKKTISYYNNIKNEYNLNIDSTSNILFPLNIPDKNKATLLPKYNVITNSIISKNRIFTNLEGLNRSIKTGVKINKSANNYVFINTPEGVYESNIDDILTGKYPYFFIVYGNDVSDASINLDINTDNKNYYFNTIEYNPFPMTGLMEINKISINNQNISGLKPIFYNNSNSFERTQSSYIPFNPIYGNIMNLNLTSKFRIESINGSCLGIEMVEAFETIYNDLSYFGYAFIPSVNKKITGIKLTGNWCNPFVNNVSVKIYDNIDDFNQINDKYIATSDNLLSATLNLIANKTYYFLFTMKCESNFPDTIKNIGIRLE